MSEKCPKCGADCGKVLIWSRKWRLWYRPEAAGYTGLIVEAGRFWRCDASGQVRSAEYLVAQTEQEAYDTIGVIGLDDSVILANQRIRDLRNQLAQRDAELEKLRAVVEKLHRALNNALVFVAHDSNAYWAGLGALATSSPELPLTVAFADEVIRIRETAEAAKEAPDA